MIHEQQNCLSPLHLEWLKTAKYSPVSGDKAKKIEEKKKKEVGAELDSTPDLPWCLFSPSLFLSWHSTSLQREVPSPPSMATDSCRWHPQV